MMDEDRLKDQYDRIFTHNNPHSPYYDGPDEDDVEICIGCREPIPDCTCKEEETWNEVSKSVN